MTRQEALDIYRRHGLLLAQFGVREDVAEKLVELDGYRERYANFCVESADNYSELSAVLRAEVGTTLRLRKELSDEKRNGDNAYAKVMQERNEARELLSTLLYWHEQDSGHIDESWWVEAKRIAHAND